MNWSGWQKPCNGEEKIFQRHRNMLLEFYGRECPHCQAMEPKIARLTKETGVVVEKFEIWHNEENAKKMEQYDKGLCGGVPFFYNTSTCDYLCGDTSFEELKKWASEI